MDIHLLLFIKAPLPGLTKTRLAASLGQALALEAYRAMVGNVLLAADASELPVTLYYAPADARPAVVGLCGADRAYQPQAAGDLGERMAAAFAHAFSQQAEGALLIGCDLPLLTGELLKDGASRLRWADAVLGPASDGGYWAIGFTRSGFCPAVFEDMPWSTGAVGARTAVKLCMAGRRMELLPGLSDCDEAADLVSLSAPPCRSRLSGTPFGFFLSGLPRDPFDQFPSYRLSLSEK